MREIDERDLIGGRCDAEDQELREIEVRILVLEIDMNRMHRDRCEHARKMGREIEYSAVIAGKQNELMRLYQRVNALVCINELMRLYHRRDVLKRQNKGYTYYFDRKNHEVKW